MDNSKRKGSRTYQVRCQYRLHGGVMSPAMEVETNATYRAALNYLFIVENIFRTAPGIEVSRNRALLEVQDHNGFNIRIWFEQER